MHHNQSGLWDLFVVVWPRVRTFTKASLIFSNTTSTAIKQLPGPAVHPDLGFDWSRYQADLFPTNSEGAPTRHAGDTPRLYDAYSSLPGAPTSRERERLVMLEPGGQHSQPSQIPQTYPGGGEDIRRAPQPETQPNNPEQLIAEVIGILAGLLMVEARLPDVDAKQTAACRCSYQPKLNNEQWQALIALRSALVHEYHDSSASQRPSAGPSLRQLAPNYSVPARMRCRQRGRSSGRCWSKGHNRKTNRGRWYCRG